MNLIIFIICVVIAGIIMGGGVHFIPVGGAPAAMATATGVGTGTAMLAAGAGLTGLMMGITMLIGNFIYIFGVGVVPASGKAAVDPITKWNQEKYKTPGTEGHGIPTVCYISGIIGGLLGGAGGGLVYWAINEFATANMTGFDATVIAGLAAILSVGMFFINSVTASYNIGGTIEGFVDPKFKRLPTGILACAIVSLVAAIFMVLMIGGI